MGKTIKEVKVSLYHRIEFRYSMSRLINWEISVANSTCITPEIVQNLGGVFNMLESIEWSSTSEFLWQVRVRHVKRAIRDKVCLSILNNLISLGLVDSIVCYYWDLYLAFEVSSEWLSLMLRPKLLTSLGFIFAKLFRNFYESNIFLIDNFNDLGKKLKGVWRGNLIESVLRRYLYTHSTSFIYLSDSINNLT